MTIQKYGQGIQSFQDTISPGESIKSYFTEYSSRNRNNVGIDLIDNVGLRQNEFHGDFLFEIRRNHQNKPNWIGGIETNNTPTPAWGSRNRSRRNRPNW